MLRPLHSFFAVSALTAVSACAQVTPPSADPGGMPGAQTQVQTASPSTLPTVQTSAPQTGLATDPTTSLQAAPQQAADSARRQALDARAAGTNPSGCPDANAPIYPGSGANAPIANGDYVELTRTRCNGSCPVYTVRVNADGSVQWTGRAFVALVGGASTQVDPVVASRLIRDFRDHSFARLCARYAQNVADASSAVTTLSVGHQTNRVRDYAGGGPTWLADLDMKIDALANTHAWRHGDPSHERFGETRLVEDTIIPKPGVTPLMKAAAADRMPEIRTILASGAAIDAEDASGWTALMYAAGPGRLSTMQFLLQNGASANHRTAYGETLLFAAATSPYDAPAKIRLLGQAGVGVNARAADGSTALMIAVEHFWTQGLVQALLALRADVRFKNSTGQTVLDLLDAQEKQTPSPAEYNTVRELLGTR
jgi:hypothetical protein